MLTKTLRRDLGFVRRSRFGRGVGHGREVSAR
jgi:hypothetical protein